MREITNVGLAKRNRQISQWLFFASFIVPIGGLILINQQAATPTSQNLILAWVVPILVLPVAYIVMMFSVRMTNLWVREPRPHAVIKENIKGISGKSTLYNYYFMPARHVLIGPQGVFAAVTRFQDGSFTVNGDKWVTHKSTISRILGIFRMDSIGNPNRDAIKAAEHVKTMLKDIAPGVTVQPIVIFTDAAVRVEIISSTVPIVFVSAKQPPSFKDYLRDVNREKRPTLTAEQIEAFEQQYIKS